MWPHRLFPSAEVKQELLDLIEMAFTQAGLLDQMPQQKGGLAVVEALLVFANEVIVTFLLPIHAGLHRGYHLFTTVIHEGGWGRGRATH